MIGYCSREIVNNKSVLIDVPIKMIDISNTFGYIGIAMFVFEGNGVILNLRAVAKNKK